MYHGTSSEVAEAIRNGGIDLSKSRIKLDFGKGFYTTNNEAQAIKWSQRSLDGGDVLKFSVPKSEFENLNGLKFSEGSTEWEEFVRNNRLGNQLHDYDYVEGPMLLNKPRNFLNGQSPVSGGHQMSFHSKDAVQRLMKYLKNNS